MHHRQMVLVVLFAGWLCVPLTARGDEVDDLKATFERGIAAVNAHDLEAVMAEQHEQIVVLSPDSPSPFDGKAARRQAYQTLFETTESFTVTPVNPQYRVIDNTGLIWGTYTIERKPKDGPQTSASVRFSRTYVKTNGQWLLVAYHLSPIPASK